MLKWALIFFVISVIAGLLGFTGVSAATAGIAKILFGIFLVIAIIWVIVAFAVGQAVFGGAARPAAPSARFRGTSP